jgi:hypothetical protein
LVNAAAVFPPPANVPLGPLVGAVNVTVAPLTKSPLASFTWTVKGAANAVLIAALCGVPEETAMLAGAPAMPVPDNATVCGLPEALSPIVNVPLRLPKVVGVKVTFTVV